MAVGTDQAEETVCEPGVWLDPFLGRWMMFRCAGLAFLVTVVGCGEANPYRKDIQNALDWTRDWVQNYEYMYSDALQPAPRYLLEKETDIPSWKRKYADARIAALTRGGQFLAGHIEKPFDEPHLLFATHLNVIGGAEEEREYPRSLIRVEWFECAEPQDSAVEGFFLEFEDGSRTVFPGAIDTAEYGTTGTTVYREETISILLPDENVEDYAGLRDHTQGVDIVRLDDEVLARLKSDGGVSIGLILSDDKQTNRVPLSRYEMDLGAQE